MNYDYTKEQKMYKESAKTFFKKEWTLELLRDVIKKEGYSREHLNKMADLGWLGMLIDEQYGGIGGSFMDLCPIIEEMGRALFPSPFFANAVMGASILSEAASEEIKNKILPAIADGDVNITLAITETADGWYEDKILMTADKQGQNYILNGSKLFVPFADVSDYIICCARDTSLNKTSLFLVDSKAKGVKIEPIDTFSIDKYSKVLFEDVQVSPKDIIGQSGSGFRIIEKLMPMFVASRCIEITGGLQQVLDITVKWVKDRHQFGKPIGNFQVIQHQCAEMAIDVETSKFISYLAAWEISENLDGKKDVSMAKAWSGDAFQRVTACALQAHGAMGFTEEYDLHFYYKQAKSLQLMYGGSTFHKKIVAKELGYC